MNPNDVKEVRLDIGRCGWESYLISLNASATQFGCLLLLLFFFCFFWWGGEGCAACSKTVTVWCNSFGVTGTECDASCVVLHNLLYLLVYKLLVI